MPFPAPPRIPPGPRRRSLLATAAGAVLLAGCSDAPEGSGGHTAGSPSLGERTRARAALDSRGLVEQYDAVLAARPALTARLAPLRAEVVRHVEAFGGRTAHGAPASASPSGSASASASPSASVSPSAPGVPVPGDDKAALAYLADAEKELADRRTAALDGLDGELARLLASVAAAGAVHAYLLTEAAR
ncbi:hypothetical protein [Streptomyces sp. NPDC057386]|uniref:hypothetical protein n=1 Tax=unclassified Streptomyces TaxID=2593676 RepID=UPI00362D3817